MAIGKFCGKINMKLHVNAIEARHPSQPPQPPREFSSSNVDTDGFVTVTRKKNKRRAKHVVGTGTNERLQGAPEPSREFFVSRTREGTVEDDLVAFLKEKNIEPRAVEKVVPSKYTPKFPSFRVELSLSDAKNAMKTSFWPKGVCTRRYYNHDSSSGARNDMDRDDNAQSHDAAEETEETLEKQIGSDG